MVDGHKDLLDQLESRIDKKGLDQWKVEMKGKTRIPAGGVAVLPDKSDNKTTMRINQFAASDLPRRACPPGGREGTRAISRAPRG